MTKALVVVASLSLAAVARAGDPQDTKPGAQAHDGGTPAKAKHPDGRSDTGAAAAPAKHGEKGKPAEAKGKAAEKDQKPCEEVKPCAIE